MGGTVIIGEEGEDPGWRIGWSSLPLMLVPQLALKRAGRGDILVGVRRAWLGMATLLVLATGILTALGDIHDGKDQPALSLAVICGDGVMSLVLGKLFGGKLDGSSASALGATYLRRFYLRVAFANSAGLMGAVMSIAFGPWWVVLCGLPFAAIGLAMTAPTRGAVRREQDRLSLAGCDVSLVAALRSPEYRARG